MENQVIAKKQLGFTQSEPLCKEGPAVELHLFRKCLAAGTELLLLRICDRQWLFGIECERVNFRIHFRFAA